MAPTTDVTITIPTFEGIADVLAAAYYATVVAHPYIVGFLLILWSYHPEKPIQALRYTTWTFPKYCVATIRGWIQSKTEPEVYKPLAGWSTPGWATPSPYAYTATGAGCSLGCCNPAPNYTSPYTSPYSSPYTSFYYPSTLPSYGSVPAFTSKAYDLEKESKSGDGLGLWQIFGWGLWICGLAVMLAYGRSAV